MTYAYLQPSQISKMERFEKVVELAIVDVGRALNTPLDDTSRFDGLSKNVCYCGRQALL